jgi:hypothetical protein
MIFCGLFAYGTVFASSRLFNRKPQSVELAGIRR